MVDQATAGKSHEQLARRLCTDRAIVLLCARQLGDRMSDVTGKLTPEQALEIVERLYQKGGEIREAVVAEAMDVLAEFTLDEIADEVFDVLDSIDVQDCWDQAGGSSTGHTTPNEAAIDFVEEELQPFFDQVERYHELGMAEQEAAYCKGVLLGIYRFEHEAESDVKQLAEEIPAECAGNLLEEWHERNPEQAGIDAMYAFIRERCPEWADWLKEE